jgi:hypothetical protein
MGGDRWLQKEYQFTLPVSRSNNDQRWRDRRSHLSRSGLDRRESFSYDGSYPKDRHASIPVGLPIIIVLLHECK